VELSETIQLPRGFDWETPDAIDLDERQASLACDWKVDGRALQLEAACQVDRRTIPADDFPGLRRVTDALEQRADDALVATR
jgi:hypothetical protein